VLAGIAMGSMQMTLDDFSACSPSLFDEAYKAFQSRTESLLMISWQQARLIAYYAILPHAKKGMKLHDILSLPNEPEDHETLIENSKERFEMIAELAGKAKKINK